MVDDMMPFEPKTACDFAMMFVAEHSAKGQMQRSKLSSRIRRARLAFGRELNNGSIFPRDHFVVVPPEFSESGKSEFHMVSVSRAKHGLRARFTQGKYKGGTGHVDGETGRIEHGYIYHGSCEQCESVRLERSDRVYSDMRRGEFT